MGGIGVKMLIQFYSSSLKEERVYQEDSSYMGFDLVKKDDSEVGVRFQKGLKACVSSLKKRFENRSDEILTGYLHKLHEYLRVVAELLRGENGFYFMVEGNNSFETDLFRGIIFGDKDDECIRVYVPVEHDPIMYHQRVVYYGKGAGFFSGTTRFHYIAGETLCGYGKGNIIKPYHNDEYHIDYGNSLYHIDEFSECSVGDHLIPKRFSKEHGEIMEFCFFSRFRAVNLDDFFVKIWDVA